LFYRFYIVGYNFNGAGPASSYAFLMPCSLPSNFAKPFLLTNTQTSVTVGWNEPYTNGGCPIYSYAVFIDDGTSTGNFAEANVDNDISVRNNPSMS
jgi:hypothetical protein